MAFVSSELLRILNQFSKQLTTQPSLQFTHQGSTVISYFVHYTQNIDPNLIDTAIKESGQSWDELIRAFKPGAKAPYNEWIQNFLIAGLQRSDLLNLCAFSDVSVLNKIDAKAVLPSKNTDEFWTKYLNAWIALLAESQENDDAENTDASLSEEDMRNQFKRSKC